MATIGVFQLYVWICDVYLNIAIGKNVTFCIIGVLTAQHEMCTNFSRPSSLPKKGRGLGARLLCIWLQLRLHKTPFRRGVHDPLHLMTPQRLGHTPAPPNQLVLYSRGSIRWIESGESKSWLVRACDEVLDFYIALFIIAGHRLHGLDSNNCCSNWAKFFSDKVSTCCLGPPLLCDTAV